MADLSDPWDWDTDRVVRELCTENRTWKPSSHPPKLPSLDRLEASLRENEVDGAVLLGNASSEVDFFPDLGIKIIKHKETVRSAIAQFRRRSKKYKIFKVRQDRDDDEHENEELDDKLDEATRKRKLEDERRGDGNRVFAHEGPRVSHPPALAPDASQHTFAPIVAPSPALRIAEQDAATAESVRKKRRIAPMTISTDVDIDSVRNIPTEADAILKRLGLESTGLEFENGQAFVEKPAYLWENALPRVELVDFDVADQLLTQEDQELEIFESRPPPYRRRRQVSRLFKRRLLGRKTVFRPAKADMIPGADNPDHNLILPPLGESDEEEEYDEQTWAEIEEEKEEREQTAKVTALTTDEKCQLMDEIIAEYISAWKQHKLPRLGRKANRIWNDARRHGLKRAIAKEQRKLESYDDRLAKYRENIVQQEWRDKAEIRKTASILEATVEDRQLSFWMLELLNLSAEPKKLPSGPRQIKPRPSRPVIQGDEEILTSDSEAGLDYFIVEDETQAHGKVISDPKIVELSGSIADAEDDTAMEGADTVNGEISPPHGPPHNENHFPNEVSTPGGLDPVAPISFDGQVQDSRDLTSIGTRSSKAPDAMDKDMPTNGHGDQVADEDEDFLDLTLLQVPKEELSKKATITRTPRHPKNSVVIDLVNFDNVVSSPQNLRTPSSQRSAHKLVEPSPQFLETLNHNERLVEREFTRLDDIYRRPIFYFANNCEIEEMWKDFILPAFDVETIPKPPFKRSETRQKSKYIASIVMRLFAMFTNGETLSLGQFRLLFEGVKQAIKDKENEFPLFVSFVRKLSAEYVRKPIRAKKNTSTPSGPPASSQSEQQHIEVRGTNKEADDVDTSEEADETLSNKKRKPVIVRDREAASLRERDRRRAEEQEQRKKTLRARLAASGSSVNQKSHLIINESKEDDQGFIYVPDKIAACIKKHQVEGVRFLWNQIVMDSQVRQGCLLAHTMGLGKTMQIITLLMVIADAAASDDKSVSDQIPDDLKESRTLILVPSGLVNNWMEELANWTNGTYVLGEFFKLHAELSPGERVTIIRDWSSYGGVLVMGYDLFKGIVDKNVSLSEDLLNRPNIVVADEAHMLKNPKSQIHKATANFRTHSRIALTGSPLANNVLEYHSMINWVAPNYLSDLKEFRQDYANPIETGLGVDSTRYERRKALTKLQVLKKTVTPKVHRRTIAVLKEDIPAKMEFVIHVPLTKIQRQAYETYMTFHSNHSSHANNAKGFAALNVLALLCNHPACFRTRLMEAKTNKAGSTDDLTGHASLPPQLVSEELQLLPNEDIDTEMYSWKIPLLNKILDESIKQGDRVLIFSQSIPTLNYLEKIFRRRKRHFLRLDGSTPINRRQNMVKDFNQNQFDVFLISTNAGGLGLNIVGANRVVIFDFKYNPQNEQQAVGRAYRLGQEKPVFVYRFVCGGTFEEKLQNKGVFKMQLASRVVDKRNPIPKAQRFEELFAMPTDPEQQDLRPFRNKDKVLDSILSSDLQLGVRSIVEADTFEEEDLEEQQLTAEEEMEAQRLFDEHQARLAGKPIPPRQDNHPAVAESTTIQELQAEPQMRVSTNQTMHMPPVVLAQAITSAPTSSSNVNPQDLSWDPYYHFPQNGGVQLSRDTAVPVVPYRPFSENGILQPISGVAQVAPIDPSSQDSTIAPVFGVSTQVRQPPARLTNRRPLAELRYWDDNPQAFKGELGRIFTSANIDSSAKEKRRQAVQRIDTAFSEQAVHRDPEASYGARWALNGARWAVMEAAKSQRFIDAIVHSMLPPDELASMDEGAITTQCQVWDEMTNDDWSACIAPYYVKADAKNQSAAPLHVPVSDGQESLSEQSEPQIRPQISHKDADQAALQELNARREARSKEPRLPVWAKDAIKTKGRPGAASSSASPDPSATNHKHTARNPFR